MEFILQPKHANPLSPFQSWMQNGASKKTSRKYPSWSSTLTRGDGGFNLCSSGCNIYSGYSCGVLIFFMSCVDACFHEHMRIVCKTRSPQAWICINNLYSHLLNLMLRPSGQPLCSCGDCHRATVSPNLRELWGRWESICCSWYSQRRAYWHHCVPCHNRELGSYQKVPRHVGLYTYARAFARIM